MPRPDDHYESLNLMFSMLASAGVVLLIGGLVAYATGEDVGRMRTHFEATMVLGTLGVACLVAAVFPFVAGLGRTRD